MIYIISDTHFFHKNIIDYTKRPICHTGLIKYNWNKIVKETDTIYHLGDLYLYNDKEKISKFLRSLSGHKYLIPGNHDKQKKWKFIKNCGFDIITDKYYDLWYNGNKIRLKHHPYEYTIGNYDFSIFGHYHNNEGQIYFSEYNGINLSPEWFGFRPIPIDEIIDLWYNFFNKNK